MLDVAPPEKVQMVRASERTCPDFVKNIAACPHQPHLTSPERLNTTPTTQDRITITTATMAENDSFLHLARPLGPASMGAQPSTAPLNVAIQPQVCDKRRERLPALLSDTL
jgi:hypothetical protein